MPAVASSAPSSGALQRVDDRTVSVRVPATAAGAEAVVAAPAPAAIAADLDDGELVIAVLHPSLWHVPLSAAGTVGAIALAILVLVWMSRLPGVPWSDADAATLGALAMGVRIVWDLIDWSSRVYVLTDRRVLRHSLRVAMPTWGLPRRAIEQAPLRHLHHVGVLASRRDRALSIGTLVFSGLQGEGETADLFWENVRQPHEVQRLVREVVERYG